MSNVTPFPTKTEEKSMPLKITYTDNHVELFESVTVGESEDLAGFLVVLKDGEELVDSFISKSSVKKIKVLNEEEYARELKYNACYALVREEDLDDNKC